MYVYLESREEADNGFIRSLFTVGFYKPDGKWNPVSDHWNEEEAAARVHYLNGGKNNE